MRAWWTALIVTLGGCGHAPQPDPGVMAGIAAAVAGAATLADPAAAGRKPESARPKQSEAAPGQRETIPPDVLDRLDEALRRSDAGP
ncbi:MAG TPA: hypothetical protein VKE22_27950 [Haliangiales bacterium]|nr:hypothetical protein [Haliangiales bacterium]